MVLKNFVDALASPRDAFELWLRRFGLVLVLAALAVHVCSEGEKLRRQITAPVVVTPPGCQ